MENGFECVFIKEEVVQEEEEEENQSVDPINTSECNIQESPPRPRHQQSTGLYPEINVIKEEIEFEVDEVDKEFYGLQCTSENLSFGDNLKNYPASNILKSNDETTLNHHTVQCESDTANSKPDRKKMILFDDKREEMRIKACQRKQRYREAIKLKLQNPQNLTDEEHKILIERKERTRIRNLKCQRARREEIRLYEESIENEISDSTDEKGCSGVHGERQRLINLIRYKREERKTKARLQKQRYREAVKLKLQNSEDLTDEECNVLIEREKRTRMKNLMYQRDRRKNEEVESVENESSNDIVQPERSIKNTAIEEKRRKNAIRVKAYKERQKLKGVVLTDEQKKKMAARCRAYKKRQKLKNIPKVRTEEDRTKDRIRKRKYREEVKLKLQNPENLTDEERKSLIEREEKRRIKNMEYQRARKESIKSADEIKSETDV